MRRWHHDEAHRTSHHDGDAIGPGGLRTRRRPCGGRTVPLSLVRVWRRVKIVPAAEGGRPIWHVKSVTDYKEFPGRSHYSVIGGEGWEEVADYALDWAVEHA